MVLTISNLLSALRAGRAIIFPTDTLYAIACDATNSEAVSKIYKLKQRSIDKPLVIFVRDVEQLKRYAVISDVNPVGADTFIMKRRIDSNLAYNVNSFNETIACRMPNHPFVAELLAKYDSPLAATSCNVSGEVPAYSYQMACDFANGSIDVVGDGMWQGSGKPSKIFDVRNGCTRIR